MWPRLRAYRTREVLTEMADKETTLDPDGEWVVPERIEMHWIDQSGASLGQRITSHVRARAAWVGLYSGRWIEIFPGGGEYARPN